MTRCVQQGAHGRHQPLQVLPARARAFNSHGTRSWLTVSTTVSRIGRRDFSDSASGAGTEESAKEGDEAWKAAQEEIKDAEKQFPQEPVVLFRGPSLEKDFARTEQLLTNGAICTGSGLGMSLLGIAPFTPPNPFMFGLLLAVLQTRLAHAWMSRQLRAQLRRNVTEITLKAEADDILLVTLTHAGGVVRQVRLREASENDSKPSFREVLSDGGKSFTFIDVEAGEVLDEEAFENLMNSDRIITGEDITVKSMAEESEEQAKKDIQRLSALTKMHLEKIKGKEGHPPKGGMALVRRSAQLTGSVILTGGLLICVGGRYTAEKQLSAA